MSNRMLKSLALAGALVLVLSHSPSHPSAESVIGAPSTRESVRVGILPAAGPSDAPTPGPSQLPLAFVANEGQWDTPAAFIARRGAMTARFERDAFVLDLVRPLRGDPGVGTGTDDDADCNGCGTREAAGLLSSASSPFSDGGLSLLPSGLERVVVRMGFEGASAEIPPRGLTPLPGRHHFFIGRDESRWRNDVPSYASLLYTEIYPGIDLQVREGSGLQYDLVLHPEADLAQFVVACEGVEDLGVDSDGSLVMSTALGPLRQSPPVTWEVLDDGSRRPVTCRFQLLDGNRYGFDAPDWNPARPLVIDPGLDWSTFLGTTSWDQTNDVMLDDAGNAIAVGGTFSLSFPTTPGVVGPTHGGGLTDAIVTKLSADGSTLLFATYLGGNDTDTILTVDIRSDGGIVAFGGTSSTDYPVTPGAFDATAVAGDVSITGLTADGSALIFSTLYGGSLNDSGRAGALGPNDEPTVVGWTPSTDLAVSPGAFQPGPLGGQDGFTFRLSADGTSLIFGSYIGTSNSNEGVLGLIPLDDGEVILLGGTEDDSGTFPMPPGGFEPTPTTVDPGLILRLSADGTALTAGTYFAETTATHGELRTDGTLAVTGIGPVPPVTPGAYSSTPGELFLAVLSADLSTLHWCTTFGDPGFTGAENIFGLSVHPDGHLAIVGQTTSDGFPTTLGAFDTEFGTFPCDGFVSMIDATGARLLYSSFLGVPSAFCQFASGIDIDATGNAVITGLTNSSAFPSTPGAYDVTWNGSADAWVLRLLIDPPFEDLGGGIGGIKGVPTLTAEGTLYGATPMRLDLSNAPRNTASILVIGLSHLSAPLYGGTLVPSVDLLVVGVPTDTVGQASLQGTWPAGVPSAFESYLQFWLPDATAPFGWAGSNGLLAVTP